MKTIIANWKANPPNLDEALGLFDFYLSEFPKYRNICLVVCPPFVFIEELAKQLQRVPLLNKGDYKSVLCSLGAQDTFWGESGPYTGEVSVDMLKNFDVSHVLVGHSDRRYKLGETDEMINRKIKAALSADIVPVLLVGEKDKGDNREAVLKQQLMADLDGLDSSQISKILIAYEPVWAISTQLGAEANTSENTLEAIKIIRNFLTTNYKLQTTNFLYGGSVTEKNVADFLSRPEISGAVIGGASLREQEFSRILKIANEVS